MRDQPALPPDIKAPTSSRGLCIVTNLFLLVFLLNGLCGAAGFVFVHILPAGLLNTLRNLCFLGCAGLFLVLVLLIGCYRKFPWGTLIPAFLTTLWIGSYYMPLPGLLEWKNTDFIGTLVCLLVSLWTFLQVRQQHGNWFIPESAFNDTQFSAWRTVQSVLVKLFVLLPLYVVYISLSCYWMLEWRGRGFIHLRSTGLTTESRIYKSEEKSVFLLPTVHTASPSFYVKLLKDVPKQRAVLLSEGVTDKNGLLQSGLSYKGVAKSAGLSEQPDFRKLLPSDGRHYDADVSDFSPSTLALLRAISKTMQLLENNDPSKVILSLSTLPEPNIPLLKHDILDARNARVSFGIIESLSSFDNIIVPWGALHMPGIEAELLKSQFKQTASREVTVFEWRDVLRALLSQDPNP